MRFTRSEQLLDRLLLIDGVGRSGKVLLAQIMTGFDRVEKQTYNEFLEYIPLAYKYGKIAPDMAQVILQTQMDTALYNSMIGRSINSRPDDYTGLYMYHSPRAYLARQTADDGPIVGQRVKEERPVYLTWCHDLIAKSDIVFDSFRDHMILLYINRRPADIVYEWNRRDFGARLGVDPTEMQYLVDFEGQPVPELAVGWEHEYLGMNQYERVVKMVHESFRRNLAALRSSAYKSQIMVVNFEELVTRPNEVINAIATFVELEQRDCMAAVLARENCPRILDDGVYKQRRCGIEVRISRSTRPYLHELDTYYDQIAALSPGSSQ